MGSMNDMNAIPLYRCLNKLAQHSLAAVILADLIVQLRWSMLGQFACQVLAK
jgi:hypothetical protein